MAISQLEYERLRKQGGGETRGLTIDGYQTEPSPLPHQRHVGDPGIAAGQNWRTVGEDEEDDDDQERQETKRPHDVRSEYGGEGEGLSKAEVNELLGGDPVCLAKEDRIFAIDRELRELRDYDTGSPATRSALRKSSRSLRQERGELANEIQVRKSQGTRNSIATNRASRSGVTFTGPLPAPKPFGLHG